MLARETQNPGHECPGFCETTPSVATFVCHVGVRSAVVSHEMSTPHRVDIRLPENEQVAFLGVVPALVYIEGANTKKPGHAGLFVYSP